MSNLVSKAKGFVKQIPAHWDTPPVGKHISYKEFAAYFSGQISLDDAADKLRQQTRRYAKRQLSWFRRMQSAHTLWVDDYSSLAELTQHAVTIYRSI